MRELIMLSMLFVAPIVLGNAVLLALAVRRRTGRATLTVPQR